MADNKWDAFIYGDVNVDIVIPGVEHFPLPGQEDVVDIMNTYVGGGAALFTLGLGKLGLNPVFQGTIGDDCYGKFIMEELKKTNTDCSLISVSRDNKTGISISFTNEKERSFLTYRGTNAEINLNSIKLDKVQKSRHIHLTGYEGNINHNKYLQLLKKVRKLNEVTISFDVGWDSTGEWYKGIYELFPYINVLFMNETEAIHYGRKDSALEVIQDFSGYCEIAVAKLGKKGAIACSKGKDYTADSYPVTAVDTTGAGDSFNAGFIYGYLKGKDIMDCLKYGNGCGALSVTKLGGNTGFPVEDELLRFIKKQEERLG
ncbi:carbohydrate kinase family protein [Anaerocolumna sp. MB42-C2]|uniref:carbohydrate kinase family protein n=1 Tax=Anaerocolumna sp. MB42-C2 TaxID=3070997 RepID=UPI0027DFE06F|nr:carbohydrate kinase family protein [Anaerocolumna sp. MB42-C2]WMJ86682.1 carbohydrate kinase family protein [Anaerocolumna sp. MB42-C2]